MLIGTWDRTHKDRHTHMGNLSDRKIASLLHNPKLSMAMESQKVMDSKQTTKHMAVGNMHPVVFFFTSPTTTVFKQSSLRWSLMLVAAWYLYKYGYRITGYSIHV